MDQISGTTPSDPPTQAHAQSAPAQPVGVAPGTQPAEPASQPTAPTAESPGFRSRGRARRRARFLRKARELAYRDLGGLVFNLHRFGQRNDALVLAKLTTIGNIDTELRALEGALGERRPVTVLREAGITACARCAAIHSSEDGFCPNCGLSMSRRVDLPADFQSAAAAPGTPPNAPVPGPQPTGPQPTVAAATAVSSAALAATRDTTVVQATTTPATGGATSAGRSPTPPQSAGGILPTPAPEAPADSPEEDRPTEILRPPVSGS